MSKPPQAFDSDSDALKIKLLQLQIECLRSVLSEYDDGDKMHFLQMVKADAIQTLLEML